MRVAMYKSPIFLSFLLLLIAITALSLGAAQVEGLWRTLLNPFASTDSQSYQIIWQIRAPRVATALLIGAALGVAGALAQGSSNNPLAEPAILGTAAGASLGVLLGVALNLATIGSITAVAFATGGALFATALVFRLSARGNSSLQLIIVGIATSAIISAVVGITISIISRPEARSISFWSLGSLALIQSTDLIYLAPLIVTAIFGAYLLAPPLDLLSLSDESAQSLGLNPQSARLKAFLVLSILVAAAVSTVGTISFIGLAAPHIARFLSGPAHRKLVISSALIGAALLLISDTAARSLVPPNELPIGLLTSLIGAPILIYLVRRRGQVWQ